MSGTNPFRHKPSPNGDLNYAYGPVKNDLPKAIPHFPALDIGRPEHQQKQLFSVYIAKNSSDAPRLKKPKTVRIVSPRSSTTDHDPTYREFPPAPYDRSPSSGSESGGDYEQSPLIDPFDIESDDGGATSEDEKEKNLHQTTIEQAAPLSPRELLMANMPPNPFRKTLASQTELTAQGHRKLPRDPGPSNSGPSRTRPHYDIDSFTRLLLTGEKNNPHATAIPIASIPDSSSNTDASSISRQSIFEPENHQDTPRTSHEVSVSDDGRQVPELAGSGSTSKTKPATPEHRHGRVVTGDVSQAVSSNSPALLIPASTFSLAAPNMHSTQTSPRTPTDLNKPLPLPPNSEFSQQEAATASIDLSHQQDSPQSSHQQLQVNRSSSTRIRPTPPVTRRYSQLRQDTLTRKPEQWTSISEEKTRELENLAPPLSLPGSKLPPPPPPRRNGRTRGLSASSTNSGISIAAAQPTTSPIGDTAPVSLKTRPPVPPARTPSMSSFKRPARVATNPNSPSLAPPPAPPPRRRRSSQSSLTPPRPSGEYFVTSADRSRADSGSSSMLLPSPSSALQPESEKKDVMADLSALQREVDEFRRQLKD